MMRVWGRDYQFDQPMKGGGFKKSVRKKNTFCILIFAISFDDPSGTEIANFIFEEPESLSGN